MEWNEKEDEDSTGRGDWKQAEGLQKTADHKGVDVGPGYNYFYKGVDIGQGIIIS